MTIKISNKPGPAKRNNPQCNDCSKFLILGKNCKPSTFSSGNYLCRICRALRDKTRRLANVSMYREKGRKRVMAWRKNNPEKALAADLRPLGLTVEEYNQLVKDQNGVCKLCNRFRPNKRAKRLCVDHDHKTGKIRGLLCDPCNRSLGVLGDTVEQFEQILDYLKGK